MVDLSEFQFAAVYSKPLLKTGHFLKEQIRSQEVLPFRVDPSQEGGKLFCQILASQ